MTKRFVLTLPDAPKSVNQQGGGARAHPFAAGKEKKHWQGQFLLHMMIAKVPKYMTHCTVDIEVRFKVKNRRDVENYRHPVVKPLADALKEGGYIEDDTEEFFKVREFRLAYPEVWQHTDPRLKSELVVVLDAEYE